MSTEQAELDLNEKEHAGVDPLVGDCCRKPSIANLDHKKYHPSDWSGPTPVISRVCLSCGKHWYGIPGKVREYSKIDWEFWMTEGPYIPPEQWTVKTKTEAAIKFCMCAGCHDKPATIDPLPDGWTWDTMEPSNSWTWCPKCK